jgi:hypothetical protein
MKLGSKLSRKYCLKALVNFVIIHFLSVFRAYVPTDLVAWVTGLMPLKDFFFNPNTPAAVLYCNCTKYFVV